MKGKDFRLGYIILPDNIDDNFFDDYIRDQLDVYLENGWVLISYSITDKCASYHLEK